VIFTLTFARVAYITSESQRKGAAMFSEFLDFVVSISYSRYVVTTLVGLIIGFIISRKVQKLSEVPQRTQLQDFVITFVVGNIFFIVVYLYPYASNPNSIFQPIGNIESLALRLFTGLLCLDLSTVIGYYLHKRFFCRKTQFGQ
jgi:uncharacterized protein YneF (UPF0154 family)